MDLQSDILAVYDNIIYTKDKRAQYWVEFKGFHTSFDSEQQLDQHFKKLRRVFKEAKKEMHLLVVPVRQSLEEVKEHYKSTFRGNLKSVAEEHTDSIFEYLQDSEELGVNENKVKYYIGIELQKTTMQQSAEDMSFKEIFTTLNEYAKSLTYKIRGIDTNFFNVDLHEKALRAGEMIQRTLNSFDLVFNKLGLNDMSRVIPWIFNFGIRELPNHNWYDAFTPIYNKHGELVARVRTEEDVLKLSMTGIENPKTRRHLVLHQTDRRGAEHKTYVSFLHVAEMPQEIFFPQTRWLEPLRNMDFTVGVSLKMNYHDFNKRLSKLRLKKANLEDQANHVESFNERASTNVYDGIITAEETIAEVEKSREGDYLLSAIFVVSASSYEQLQINKEELIEEYASYGFTLQATYGLQLKSLLECLPGSRRYVTEFMQDVDINAITSSFYGNVVELGDDWGYYEGRTTSGDPVYRLPGRAAEAETKTQSLVRAYTGKTGSGKSVSVNNSIYETVIAGGRVLALDPKDERKSLLKWDERLTELGNELNFITLSSRDEDAGKLDPFLIFDNRTDAQDVARNIINYLLNISIREDTDKSFLVSRAVEMVAKRKNPSIRLTKDELRKLAEQEEQMSGKRREMAIDMADTLEQFETVSLSKLFFGESVDESTYLDSTKLLNILQVSELQLPEKGEEPETEVEIISVAIMFGLISYMIKFMRMYPEEITEIVIEEAWNFFVNAVGERLVNKLFREGRSLLSPVALVTQNLKDVPAAIRGQIGATYNFYTDDVEDIQVIKKHLMINENDKELESLLPDLPSGWCVYRDLNKRIGIMQHRTLQAHLFEAFDTSSKVKTAEEVQV